MKFIYESICECNHTEIIEVTNHFPSAKDAIIVPNRNRYNNNENQQMWRRQMWNENNIRQCFMPTHNNTQLLKKIIFSLFNYWCPCLHVVIWASEYTLCVYLLWILMLNMVWKDMQQWWITWTSTPNSCLNIWTGFFKNAIHITDALSFWIFISNIL